jgi:YHS domain-containing protein
VISHFKFRDDLCIRFLAETKASNYKALRQDQWYYQNSKRILHRFEKAPYFRARSLNSWCMMDNIPTMPYTFYDSFVFTKSRKPTPLDELLDHPTDWGRWYFNRRER